MNNQIIRKAIAEIEKDKSKKKNDTLGSVLDLLKSLRDFMQEVEDCIDKLDDETQKDKIRKFDKSLDEFSAVLIELAKEGIVSIRNRGENMVEQPPVEESVPDSRRQPVQMMARPMIPVSPEYYANRLKKDI